MNVIGLCYMGCSNIELIMYEDWIMEVNPHSWNSYALTFVGGNCKCRMNQKAAVLPVKRESPFCGWEWFWAAVHSAQFPLLRPGADGHLWWSQEWAVFHCTIHQPGLGCGGVSLALSVFVAGYGVVVDSGTQWKWPMCHRRLVLQNQHWAVCALYWERELSQTHWPRQWLSWVVPE